MLSFLKSHNTIFLLLFSVFCSSLLFVRVLLIDRTFLFLLINLGLAWIPYLISYLFRVEKVHKMKLIIVSFIWILFFPNSLYLVTDLFQLWPRNFVSVWFDLVLLLSFAMTGLFLAFSSLKNFEELIVKKIGKKKAGVTIFFTLYIGSQGVYFGRFVRLNSWDIITQPKHLIEKVLTVFANPLDDVNFYATTLAFAIFCYIIYYGLFHFAKNHQ